MWNYLPAVERIIKIPPSMMLQPWMGSDMTNDDLVKESSVVDDYTHKLVGTEDVEGMHAYRVESIPMPEAAVVWGKLVYKIRVTDRLPIRQEYYDERGLRPAVSPCPVIRYALLTTRAARSPSG